MTFETDTLSDHAAIERVLRREWWLNHGHDYSQMYGDDGEMHCNACPADFKRDSLDFLAKRVFEARAARGQKAWDAIELAKWLIAMDDPEDVLALAERRTVTMTTIIARAKEAIGAGREQEHA